MNPTDDRTSIAKYVFLAAALVTFLFSIFVLIVMAGETCETRFLLFEICQSKWSYFWAAKPNEVGDALAGIASGLALIWIVASVVIQRIELSSTVHELRNVTEIERQRDGLREYKLALREFSTALFSGTREESIYGEWSFRRSAQENLDRVSLLVFAARSTGDEENDFGVACTMIRDTVSRLFENQSTIETRPALKHTHQQMLLSLIKLGELKSRLPPREVKFLEAVKVDETAMLLKKLIGDDGFFRR